MAGKKPLIIGIAGGSGSGKTTFLQALVDRVPKEKLALVSQDNYYQPIEMQQKDENGQVNFDLPISINREHFFDDINRLMTGKTITKTEYTFNNENREAQEIIVQPADIIVTEGLFVFHYNEIRDLLNYKVYIDAHEEIRLDRRIQRDLQERGYPENEVRYQWENHVIPAEQSYLEPFKPEVDLLVDNTHTFDKGLEELIKMIEKKTGF
ncbi:MAG: uridine kinase [Flavobacteriales bacterium]|jgi:uridine kinase